MQHGNKISAMAVGSANLLATANLQNGRVIFWNLETGDPIDSLPLKNSEWVADLAFNADGSQLAVGEVSRGATTVWDVSQLQNIEGAVPLYTLSNWQLLDKEGTPETDEKMLVDAVAFSPNEQLLATGDRFNTANLWNAKTGVHLVTLWGHTDLIDKIAFSPPDGNRLATASADGTVKIWDTKTGRFLLTLSGHSLKVEDLAFSPDGNWLATVSRDKQAKLWNIAMHSDALFSVAFSPDGKFLATGSGDKTIKIWESGSLELVKTLVGHTDRIQKLVFSPDGKFLASASFDKTARIWDWSTGKEVVAPLQYPDTKYGYDKVYDLAYSADGQWLATAGANYNAAVWDATGHFKFSGRHGGQVSAVAFSPDSKYLASVDRGEGQVKIWEIPSGTLVTTICNLERRGLYDVNFSSPDGDDLVMATDTREIFIVHGWKRYLKEPLASESTDQDTCKNVAMPLPGSERPIKEEDATVEIWSKRPIVTMAKFTPDGRDIVTIGTKGRQVNIWDASSGDERKSLQVPTRINAITISHDGNRVAVAGEDMNFYLFPLKAKDWMAWGCAHVTRSLTDKECQAYLGNECPPKPCP